MKIIINACDQECETEIVVNCWFGSKDIEKLLDAIRGLSLESDISVGDMPPADTAQKTIDNKLSGYKDGRQFLLAADTIMFTDTNNRRSFLYTHDDCYESDLKSYELENVLTGAGFLRANKSCLYNFKQIKSIEPDIDSKLELTMKNDMKVVVSRQYAPDLRKKLEAFHGQ